MKLEHLKYPVATNTSDTLTLFGVRGGHGSDGKFLAQMVQMV